MVAALPGALKVDHPLIHARITRNSFSGTVIDIERDAGAGEIIYLVKYDDGDLEHLTGNEIRACMDSGGAHP